VAVTIEVCHQDEQWHVRRQGERESLSSHGRKDNAASADRVAAERESGRARDQEP
jgi:hypothetical protein